MKVSDTSVIESSERELMDTIIAELDWSAIEQLLRQKHKIGLQDDVHFREGDMVVHEGKVAYKLSFDVKITLDVVFDRKGECIYLSAAGDEESGDGEETDTMEELPRNSAVTSELADMLGEINSTEDPDDEALQVSDSEENPEEFKS
ncbi:hypothetical protein LZ24_03099 [Desulfobotulus alkaliphilus]|uniref:Uncharacterized protein n=1 Tax=Desulfobotulus alkaliphilus TaxID=622671 RepID=A0A562R6Z7_9BACT|nr:hypothetical protein [Desulfobotulus alkaliphilus]TWI64831.1 hypothetical protein LZ24_03099 [Desulfobotulus alkaliphilus]